ncbi:MAG TPA: hypothetical protein VI195_08335, partial [Steroidobacteraceae bacterium]
MGRLLRHLPMGAQRGTPIPRRPGKRSSAQKARAPSHIGVGAIEIQALRHQLPGLCGIIRAGFRNESYVQSPTDLPRGTPAEPPPL